MVSSLYPEERSKGSAAYLELVRDSRRGTVPNLFRMLGHNLPIAKAWLSLGSSIRFDTSLDDAVRELAICQVAARTGCQYELSHHQPLALQAGVPEALLRALPGWRSVDVSERQRVVLEHVDNLLERGHRPPSESVLEGFGSKGTAELTATVGYYLATSAFCRGMLIEEDDASNRIATL